MQTVTCPKCRSEMEEGFVADNTSGAVLPSQWVEGEPEKSFWTRTKMRGKVQVQIRTYRCPQCGYLESYAK
ncbi:MAG: hypothetical protein QOJ16_3479 [Acidobacteriota bacterium]|nr:hypothetical protein [Acidobacteriota bacterium]